MCADERGYAVTHVAYVLEEFQEPPTQIATFRDEQERHAGGHHELGDPDLALPPQAYRIPDHRDLQDRSRQVLKSPNPFRVPQRRPDGAHLSIEILVQERPFVLEPSEQLHAGQVGHRIHDLANGFTVSSGRLHRVRPAAQGQQERAPDEQHGPRPNQGAESPVRGNQ